MRKRRVATGVVTWADNYELRVLGERWACHYCGMPADTTDHVPPLSRYHDAMNDEPQFVPFRVPACRECNELGGDGLETSFLVRADRIKFALADKYAHVLRMPAWTSAELQDMSDRFVASIRLALAMKRLVRARLDYLPMELKEGVKGRLFDIGAIVEALEQGSAKI